MCENYEQYPDEVLIEQLRSSGNVEIMDYLVNRYKDMVRKKTRALYLVGGETEDLIQEGMIGLFKAVRDYVPEKEASFQTFAGLCVERQLYKAIASSNCQKHIPLNTYVSLSEEEDYRLSALCAENPESIIINQENTRILEARIQKSLSPLENRVLKYYLQGESYTQIGEMLNRSPKSIDNALRRIRTKLRACMEEIHDSSVKGRSEMKKI